jgi:hypothetical protein
MDSEPTASLKCSCIHCGGHLAYLSSQAGSKVACPHCGQETPLFSLSISFDLAPPTSAPPAPKPAAATVIEDPPLTSLAHYPGGEEVHLGDRVRYKDTLGQVVFVSDGTHCQWNIGYEDYRGYDAGILVCDDDGGTDFVREDDERLELVGHRSA